jgi:argininosuccinate lyase
VGRLIRHAEETGQVLPDFTGPDAAAVDPHLSAIRPEWWDARAALDRRSVGCGSAPDAVRRQLEEARSRL